MAKKKEVINKEVTKVVDEVTIEETSVTEEKVEEKVEEIDVDITIENPVKEIIVNAVIENPNSKKVEGKGKIVKLSHRVAVYEDGTELKITSKKQHAELRKQR